MKQSCHGVSKQDATNMTNTHTQINTYIIQYSNLILKNKHYKIEYSVMTYDKIKWNII